MSAKKVISGIVGVWGALTGFLEKHVADLNAVGGALTGVISGLPIDPQDKQRITDAIEQVERSAENITNWLANAPSNPGEVTIKESDIVNSIGNYFKTQEGIDLLKSILVPSAEGNGNAG